MSWTRARLNPLPLIHGKCKETSTESLAPVLNCGTCEGTARRAVANMSATVTPRTTRCRHRIFSSELSGLHQDVFSSGWSPRSCLAISALWFATPQIPVVISVTFPTATVQSWDSEAACLIQQSSPTNHLLLETSTTVASGRLSAKLGERLQNGKEKFCQRP